jgi:hypothetical protein
MLARGRDYRCAQRVSVRGGLRSGDLRLCALQTIRDDSDRRGARGARSLVAVFPSSLLRKSDSNIGATGCARGHARTHPPTQPRARQAHTGMRVNGLDAHASTLISETPAERLQGCDWAVFMVARKVSRLRLGDLRLRTFTPCRTQQERSMLRVLLPVASTPWALDSKDRSRCSCGP